LSLIKNWRPISLLPCFYKVISRAVNNRLKLFNDKFCSRAQKGFTSSRQIQEVILNINQSIGFCNAHNISAALVSVDLAKAFDTILHGYVRETFKFFNVGENFLDIMDTIGTGRYAQILLSDNKPSRKFQLNTGRPQGDTPSPISFNVGEQILLFKLELDPEIRSVYSFADVPCNNFPILQEEIPPSYRYESNAETDKIDAFADDANAITVMELSSLTRLKKILNDFGEISGLLCNFDKTAVMHIGNTDTNIDFFQETGFELVTQIKLLGFYLNKHGLMSDTMFNKARTNICTIITQWSRFKLSLAGRINIYKNLLLSQLGYYGSIVSPTPVYLESINNIMINFVTGGKRVSKDRLFVDTNKGGLGLINIKTFFLGLQASWVTKAYSSTRDNWRVDLHSITSGLLHCKPRFY
jgi:hypothetical protein